LKFSRADRRLKNDNLAENTREKYSRRRPNKYSPANTRRRDTDTT
jgi:hypothetical protein